MSDVLFGSSAKALALCEKRAEMISHNIANASTPHYQATDINFKKLMQEQQGGEQLSKTHANHLSLTSSIGSENAMYRIPMQQSLDGNTVDEEIERKNFLENALRYQVNLTFIQNKSDELMRAIKGE